jgi:hypothetical protein
MDRARSRWSEPWLVTLLVVLVLTLAAGGYVGHEWTIVRERIAIRAWVEERGGGWLDFGSNPQPSWVRRILGDFPDPEIINLRLEPDKLVGKRIERAFSESTVLP